MSSPYVRRLWLGREIRALRAERNWTQARLARLAGVTRNNVSKLENAQTTDLAEALNILEALGIQGPGKVVFMQLEVALAFAVGRGRDGGWRRRCLRGRPGAGC